MGIFSKKPKNDSGSSGSDMNKPPRKQDPYVTGNPNDWDDPDRDPNEGESFRNKKKKK